MLHEMQNIFMSCQEKYQQHSPQCQRHRKGGAEVPLPRWSSRAAPWQAMLAPRRFQQAGVWLPPMAPALSAAQASPHTFSRWDSLVWCLPLLPHQECHWLMLSLWSRFFPEKLLLCFFFPTLSLCRRLILPQSRSLFSSLLNWTLFFF